MLTEAQREKLRDKISTEMSDEIYYCTRHSSAWGVGTMSLDDFTLAGEDEDILNNFVDAVESFLEGN